MRNKRPHKKFKLFVFLKIAGIVITALATAVE